MKIINNVVIGGSSSNIKYYDISALDDLQKLYIAAASLFQKFINSNGFVRIATFFTEGTPLAVAIDFNVKLSDGNEVLLTVEKILQNGNIYDSLIACPELTEEQFYDLTLPTE